MGRPNLEIFEIQILNELLKLSDSGPLPFGLDKTYALIFHRQFSTPKVKRKIQGLNLKQFSFVSNVFDGINDELFRSTHCRVVWSGTPYEPFNIAYMIKTYCSVDRIGMWFGHWITISIQLALKLLSNWDFSFSQESFFSNKQWDKNTNDKRSLIFSFDKSLLYVLKFHYNDCIKYLELKWIVGSTYTIHYYAWLTKEP